MERRRFADTEHPERFRERSLAFKGTCYDGAREAFARPRAECPVKVPAASLTAFQLAKPLPFIAVMSSESILADITAVEQAAQRNQCTDLEFTSQPLNRL